MYSSGALLRLRFCSVSRAAAKGNREMGQVRNTQEKGEMRAHVCEKVLLFVVDLY